jgi:hypothetical protein
LARQAGDEGKPVVLAGEGSASAPVLKGLGNQVKKILFPNISK